MVILTATCLWSHLACTDTSLFAGHHSLPTATSTVLITTTFTQSAIPLHVCHTNFRKSLHEHADPTCCTAHTSIHASGLEKTCHCCIFTTLSDWEGPPCKWPMSLDKGHKTHRNKLKVQHDPYCRLEQIQQPDAKAFNDAVTPCRNVHKYFPLCCKHIY